MAVPQPGETLRQLITIRGRVPHNLDSEMWVRRTLHRSARAPDKRVYQGIYAVTMGMRATVPHDTLPNLLQFPCFALPVLS